MQFKLNSLHKCVFQFAFLLTLNSIQCHRIGVKGEDADYRVFRCSNEAKSQL